MEAQVRKDSKRSILEKGKESHNAEFHIRMLVADNNMGMEMGNSSILPRIQMALYMKVRQQDASTGGGEMKQQDPTSVVR
jgi:hypothetical protein